MEKFIILSVLVVFCVASVNGQECDTCFSWMERTCTAAKTNCTDADSKCGMIVGELNNGSLTSNATWKGCVKCSDYLSSACNASKAKVATINGGSYTIPDCDKIKFDFVPTTDVCTVPTTNTAPPAANGTQTPVTKKNAVPAMNTFFPLFLVALLLAALL